MSHSRDTGGPKAVSRGFRGKSPTLKSLGLPQSRPAGLHNGGSSCHWVHGLFVFRQHHISLLTLRHSLAMSQTHQHGPTVGAQPTATSFQDFGQSTLSFGNKEPMCPRGASSKGQWDGPPTKSCQFGEHSKHGMSQKPPAPFAKAKPDILVASQHMHKTLRYKKA